MPKINWGPTLFLIIYQVLLLISLPFYFYYASPSLSLVIVTFVLLYLTGLSITAGYHRYFSHRTYKTHPWMEWVILFFSSMGAQGSALRWSFDHRQHHAHVDTDKDPYSIKKGFWYAHFGWIVNVPETIDPKVVSDLMRNPRVMHQHNYNALWMIITNIIAFLAVGWALNDFLGAFVMAVWVRMFALHHFTWFINSLAHTWGDRPFCQEQSAVDNYIISLLTFGEGYHNYHHTFANDYRNGVRWFHFDPTKWLIWTLQKCGIAYGLKKMDWETINKRMVIEKKELLSSYIERIWLINKEEWQAKVNALSEQLLARISSLSKLKADYRKYKYVQIKQEIKALKASIRNDWRLLKQMLHALTNLPQVTG